MRQRPGEGRYRWRGATEEEVWEGNCLLALLGQSKFHIPEKTGDKRTQTLPSIDTSGRGSVSIQGISREVGRLEGSCRKAVDTSNTII